MSKHFSQALNLAVEETKENKKEMYVYYMDGMWQSSTRLPSLIDFYTFYVVKDGYSYAVTF